MVWQLQHTHDHHIAIRCTPMSIRKSVVNSNYLTKGVFLIIRHFSFLILTSLRSLDTALVLNQHHNISNFTRMCTVLRDTDITRLVRFFFSQRLCSILGIVTISQIFDLKLRIMHNRVCFYFVSVLPLYDFGFFFPGGEATYVSVRLYVGKCYLVSLCFAPPCSVYSAS